ncbi:MAG: dihydroorotate dehydrogenase-like protein [Anaerolineales bacterium]|uniref:dihydroorotate dehydrogenase-like protein n=1 Tax=Promineifilum sp. TaxID=2664178 RepID=UPI001DDA62F0|nr:dihydroorotate dehydrogenase-like protein [Anaerolineales bacterium]MCB8935042.1 dihydroorotate dehydrogenase-like protein [Promineifilum sp.]MCO5181008.1 dihydroorotate dehydrogenase-like protein [Promineifilum sp.]
MDLRTNYLGLELKNPLVASASPLARELVNIRRMEDAGAAAVVLNSLFEEEINQESHALDRYLSDGTESYAEALTYFPEAPSYKAIGPDSYLEHIFRAKQAVDIPIIASLNGVSSGGWIRYAKEMEGAGADALELNIYYLPTSIDLPSSEVEQIYIDLVHDVRASINIPIAVKLSPYFSSTANMMRRLSEAGANGLVLFNRFYQPDLDLENLEVVPNLILSKSDEMRLPLRWIAILYGRVAADLALTTGVHTAEDALKAVAAGANVAMMTSEILLNGISRFTEILSEMKLWLEDREYLSIRELHGSLSQVNVAAPAAFERANYIQIVKSYAPTFR